MARVSIITPVFNGETYLAGCIENVRSQNVEGLEHIVVDGGSSDNTVNLLADFATKYRHIRYISEKDRGQSDAMNKGVAMASSDIIGMLNVDDFYNPGAVQGAVDFLARNLNTDLVAGDCSILDANGTLEHINKPKDLRYESLLLGWEYAEYPVNPSAYFYRKRIHAKVGEYEVGEHFLMDVRFLYACAAKTRMAYVPLLWGNFRLSQETKTVRNQSNAPEMMRKLRQELTAKLPANKRLYMHFIKHMKQLARFRARLFRTLKNRARRYLFLQLKT